MPEFSNIEKYFKPLTEGHKAARNLQDDVAAISLKKDEELVVSKDMFAQNVHFLPSDGAYKIASKLLRTNISDLAAAGAKPLYYSLGFSNFKNCTEKFVAEFSRGLRDVQNEFGLCLIGGDTVSTNEMFFSITIFGVAKKGKILGRSNAKNGDLIFVSGNIGDAHLGLQIKLGNEKRKLNKSYFLDRHFFPTPRINLGLALNKNNLSRCAIDISDGLLAEANHLAQASKLDAEIHFEKIPFYDQSLASLDLISGGDDYELLFSVKKKDEKKIYELAKSLKIKLSCIGEFKKTANKKPQVTLLKEGKKIPIKKFGYEHF